MKKPSPWIILLLMSLTSAMLILVTLNLAQASYSSFDFEVKLREPTKYAWNQDMEPGYAVSYTVRVNLLEGTSQIVTLSVSGLPSGLTASFYNRDGPPTWQVLPTTYQSLYIKSSSPIPGGTYHFDVIGEGGGLTRKATATLIVQSGELDGKVTDITVNKSTLTPDQTAQVQVTVKNTGDIYADYCVNFWGQGVPPFDHSSETDPSECLSLYPNQTGTVTLKGHVPDGREPGTYDVDIGFRMAPHQGLLRNTQKVGTIKFTVVGEIPGYIKIKVTNDDDDKQDVRAYIDGDWVFSRFGISPGGSYTSDPISRKGDSYHTIEIIWHDDDTGKDYSKSKTLYLNAGETVTTSFTIDPHLPPPQELPDLTITKIGLSPYRSGNEYTAGENITIYPTVKNEGSAAANNFKVNFYADESLIHSWPGWSLEAGGSISSLGVKWTVVEDTHTIKVIVDPDDIITELDETDQVMTKAIVVSTPSIAASITGFNVEDGTKRPGDVVKASATINNDGNISHTFRIDYSIRDSKGVYRGVYNSNVSITAGATLELGLAGELDWTIPQDIAEGNCEGRLLVLEPDGSKTYDSKWDDGPVIEKEEENIANCVVGRPTQANVGENTELMVVVNLTEEPCKSRIDFGDPVQWFITKPDGSQITGEVDNLKCCFAGGPYDKAYYNFPIEGVYIVKVEFLNTGDWASWKVDALKEEVVDASIAYFSVEDGTKNPGDTITARASISNDGNVDHTFKIDYSIRSSTGHYYGVYSEEHEIPVETCLELGLAGELDWTIPQDIAEGNCEGRLLVLEPDGSKTYDSKWDDGPVIEKEEELPSLVNVEISPRDYSVPNNIPPYHPGDRIRVWYEIDNPRDSSVDVRLDYSIRDGGNWIDDPANDKAVTISANSTEWKWRYFDIPSDAPISSHDSWWRIRSPDLEEYDSIQKTDYFEIVATPDAASIVSFTPPSGDLKPNDDTSSTVEIKNTGETTRSFWVGLSFQKPDGDWYDVPPKQTEIISPNETDTLTFNWTIPSDAPSGSYDAWTAIWDGYDSSANAMIEPKYDEMLVSSAFTVESDISFSPSSISVSMNPGEIIAREINILNESDSEIEISLWYVGAIGEWIGGPPSLSLPPKTSEKMTFAITVPPGTERDSYVGGIDIYAGVKGSSWSYLAGTIDITVQVLGGGSEVPIEIPEIVGGQKLTEIAEAYQKRGESYDLFVSIYEEEPYYVVVYHDSSSGVLSGSLVVNTEGNILSPISTPISIFSPPAVAINYHPDWDYLKSSQSYVLLRESLKEGSSKISEGILALNALLVCSGVEGVCETLLLAFLPAGEYKIFLDIYSNATFVSDMLEIEDCREHLAHAASCYKEAANVSDSLAYAWLHLSPKGGYTQAADLFADLSGPKVLLPEYAIDTTTSLKESARIFGVNAEVLDELDKSISSLEESKSISTAIVENIIESRSTLSQKQRTAPSIGAEVIVESEEGELEIRSEVYDPEIQIETKAAPGKITVDITSHLEEGRTLVVNINTSTLPISEPSEVAVLYDGNEIGVADNYSDVLNPNDEEVPEYLVLLGARGTQVLISIPHFSTHTITVAKVPTFKVSSFSITPAEVTAGESFIVSVNVASTGGLEGTYPLTLKIDGVVENVKEVTLEGGENRTVTFTLTKDAGTYTIEIAGLEGTVTVTPRFLDLRIIAGAVAVLAIVLVALIFHKRRSTPKESTAIKRQVKGKEPKKRVAKTTAPAPICWNCGRELTANARVCPACGVEQKK